jgi:two-component system chemotaxis sensor kinase CheA
VTISNLDFIAELQDTYLAEASEMIENLEGLFLCFEANPGDITTFQAIFRIAHTLKGSARSVMFTEFADFAHVIENLLEKIKSSEVKASSEVIDTLLGTVDTMRSWVAGLKENRAYKPEFQRQLIILKDLAQSKSQTKANVDTSPIPAEPDPAWGIFDESDKKVATVAAKPQEKPDESVRLPMSRIDALLDLFGEQVILQASLEQARREAPLNHELTDGIVSQLGKITYDLQHTVMSLRMVSLTGLFHKMQRTARDTAKSLDKRVDIESSGEDMELDKMAVDQLSGAVTHLIRNAIDHGIEQPSERERKGKSPVARLSIRASQENGRFSLTIADDGRGLDKDKIIRKALQQGLITSSDAMSDDQIYQLIFRSGFSTADQVSDVSGRGVGMDAVKSVVESLRGEVRLQTQSGLGTIITIRLPLNMAIFNGMVFRLASDRYILPSRDIKEVICYESRDIHEVSEDQTMIVKDDKTLTVVDVRKFLYRHPRRKRTNPSQRCIALVVHKNDREYALEVDEIIGQQRVVLKKLGRELENFPNVSGGAILGDGQVAMILNLDAIGS